MVAEEIVDPEVIASDPNRTVIPGFLVNAVVECRYGAHPSPVQGYYKRDDAFFRQYHEQTKTTSDSDAWLRRWVYGVADRLRLHESTGACRVEELAVKRHAYAAQSGFWILKASFVGASVPLVRERAGLSVGKDPEEKPGTIMWWRRLATPARAGRSRPHERSVTLHNICYRTLHIILNARLISLLRPQPMA